MTKLFLRFGYKILKIVLKMFNKIPCNIMIVLGKERKDYVFEYHDYIRASSLELIANEIYDKNIDGNVAELGVYRGDFARLINKTFPDRELYLFDTFEGFDSRDVKTELKNNFSNGKEDFSDTNVELVLGKMQNRENCIVKKGFFPETAVGINNSFSFVSIDADLYDPVYNGLHFFYDRLNSGGYIMLHDYNNKYYNGAKAALRKFSTEKKISYFPICDPCGRAVIMKPSYKCAIIQAHEVGVCFAVGM
jgi:O-methyltransferase